MTRKQALAEMNALGHVLASYDSETGEYRVTLRFGPLPGGRGAQEHMKARREAVASYTPDRQDALDTARAMAADWEAKTPEQRERIYRPA